MNNVLKPGQAEAAADRPVISVRGLERWLGHDEGRVHVLRALDLDLWRGRSCAIVGPSGCGKSTLLYLLGLLDRPDRGEIRCDGERLDDASDERRTLARNTRLGFVFQFHFLLPEFTAAENVMLPMRKRGIWREAEMRARAVGLLEAVDLGGKVNRYANHLSGGEQQRVAIARALANDPALILADEPTGNLDGRNSSLVFDLLAQVAHRQGQSVLVVTHNLELAARCDERRIMRDGVFIS